MIQSFRTLLLAFILSIGISYAYAAWAPPTAAPTGGNAEAPVNAGGATQVKAGGFGVNGLLTALSNLVVGSGSPVGSVTINNTTANPWIDVRSNGDANNYSAISLWSNQGGNWAGVDKRWAIGHRKLAGEQNNFFIEECNGNCLLGNPANYAQRITVKPGGNVGIGTLNPTVKLDIAGGVKVGDTSSCVAGTIRFRGGDFEGCTDGTTWKSLTTSASAPSGPQQYQCPNVTSDDANQNGWKDPIGGAPVSCLGQLTTYSSCQYSYCPESCDTRVRQCTPQ